jgi:hypothetical protein
MAVQITDLFPLTRAAKLWPPVRAAKAGRFSKRIHIKTLQRYARTGCRGIVLRTVMAGGIRCTTVEWIEDFFRELTAARSASPLTPRERSARREAELERVEAALSKRLGG